MALIRTNLGCSFRDAHDPRTAFSVAGDEVRSPVRARKTARRLAALRQLVEKLERSGTAPAAHLPLGLIEIDRFLPGAGLASGAIHEVTAAAHGDKPAAFGFAIAVTALNLRLRRGPAVFIASHRCMRDFGTLYGHGLEGIGLDAARFMLVETRSDKDALWALEETLRSKTRLTMVLGAVAGEAGLTMSRRLSLAAAASGTPLLLLSSSAGREPSAALTRWRIGAAPPARDCGTSEKVGPFARSRWRVALERCRHGRTGQWLLEWNHVAHCFHLARGVADHAPHAGRGQERRRLTS